MFAFFAEDLDEEFRSTVDDLWVAVEIGIGVYEAVEGDDLFDLIERADGFFDDGEAVEDDDACSFDCIFYSANGRDFAEHFSIAINRESAGKEEEISAADTVHISGDGCRDFWKFEAERFDFGEDVVLHGGILIAASSLKQLVFLFKL